MPGSTGQRGLRALIAVAIAVFAGAATGAHAAGEPAPPGASGAQEPPPEYEIPTAPKYMRPFPVVRIRGELARGGARVRLLRVTGGRRPPVRARCRGAGRPVSQQRRSTSG